ncbi:MAG: hypothetical protein OES32_06470 [Acidobacteriota bacterium]|nr:hypothetical protein [Acidobacteriota bacterium]MDH3523213.1 hypothetical protein [Acidobacteriota bacterium]
MAELPPLELVFEGTCPDCGSRELQPQPALPAIGDDFDWLVRDFKGFRRFMLEELAARFPERSRWTPADLEVVLVELLAAVLDQLSDTLDRVSSEAYLETARRPASVRRLLRLIGYDAPQMATARKQIVPAGGARVATAEELDAYWLDFPSAMEEARRDGPAAVHQQRRMVTVDDYAERLEDHPLVERAHAWSDWTGSWTTIRIAVVGWNNLKLDDTPVLPTDVQAAVSAFHGELALGLPELALGPSIRAVLRPYLEAFRMIGQEVVLQNAEPVGINMALSVRVAENYFQSEVRRAVREALGTGPEGFFRPGRLAFGEDLRASDVMQTLMALDGVESVCLNRFKRLDQVADQAASGHIKLEGLELAVCDNDPTAPARGYYRLFLHGGRKG